MGRLKVYLSLLLVLGLFLFAFEAAAVPVWGTDASGYLKGYRSNAPFNVPDDGGITATGVWDTAGITLDWLVKPPDDINPTFWTYEYTFAFDPNATQGDVSHFILEISEGFFSLDDYSPEGSLDPEDSPGIFGPHSGNPNFPEDSDVYGLKFDAESLTYSLIIDKAPVWGVFYAKGGKTDGVDATAWSNALNDEDYRTNEEFTINDFIVRPDGAGGVPVPEPATLLLLGMGLIGLGGVARKRLKK